MSKTISDVAIKELSLIFGEHKGEKWAPINGEAKVLSVKGSPSSSFLNRFVDTLKGMYNTPYSNAVNVEVPDNVDGDGDGATDYNQIVQLLCNTFSDLQSCFSIDDDNARAAAICSLVDGFREAFDSIYSGDDAKGGKRHSKEDMASLNDMVKQHAAMGDSLKALGVDVNNANADNEDDDEEGDDEAKAARVALKAFVLGEPAENGLPDNITQFEELVVKAKTKKAPKGDYGSHDDAGYADQGYQEDKKPRYPLKKNGKFNKKRVAAAARFIGVEANRAKYSAGDLKKVEDAIAAAEKEPGIGEKGQPTDAPATATTELTVNVGTKAVEASVMQALDEAIKAARVQSDAAIQTALATAKAESDAKIAVLTTSLDAANATVKAMAQDALKPTSPGFTPTRTEDGGTIDPAAEAAKAAASEALKKASAIGDVIRLQRIAHS